MKPDTMFFLLYATALVVFGVHKAAQSGPAVHLTANPPWPDVFRGETITLSCQVIESEGWTFVWTRHGQGPLAQLPASSSNGSVSVLVLSDVRERQSGMYQCEAVKGNERAFSNIHTITVSADRPQAVIVTDPPASVMFTGETVSLACEIRKGSGWRYSWSRNTQGRLESLYARNTESQQKHILHSVRESDSGEYLCQGERGQSPVIQSSPGSLVLNVSGEKPRPVITQNPPSGELYTGERVTLSCGFGGDPAGWEYLWYKDVLRHTVPNTDSSRTDGSSFTISSAALAHSGEYRCRAARGRKPFYSDHSDPLTLEISEENLQGQHLYTL
ncbi:Fc receptor-like protein 5 [Anguilla rostrata]|uniref:Fc receptor-like protein 5 n=1 Tax=Anguilla rostrata TaxID=7938 RepID=UPI0030D0FCF2